MDNAKKISDQMTVVEALDKLEEFKQKLIDRSYEELMQEGEANVKIDFETLESIEIILYYISTLEQLDDQDL
jgi:hypothetical protein